MLRHMSPSSTSTGLRCGEQFRRRYFLGEIIPPGVAAGRGRGVHKAADINWGQKIITGEDLPLSIMLDATRDGFVQAFDNGVYLSRKEVSAKDRLLNEQLNQALSATRLLREKVAPKIQPIESEIRLEADIGIGIPLLGFLDIIKQNHIVGDLKTSARRWPENRPLQELQPPLYTYLYQSAYGVIPKTFEYDILVCNKSYETAYQPLATDVTAQMINGALNRVVQVYRMAEAGLFPPAEASSWCCSEKWCGYWHTCKYVGNGSGSWV